MKFKKKCCKKHERKAKLCKKCPLRALCAGKLKKLKKKLQKAA